MTTPWFPVPNSNYNFIVDPPRLVCYILIHLCKPMQSKHMNFVYVDLECTINNKKKKRHAQIISIYRCWPSLYCATWKHSISRRRRRRRRRGRRRRRNIKQIIAITLLEPGIWFQNTVYSHNLGYLEGQPVEPENTASNLYNRGFHVATNNRFMVCVPPFPWQRALYWNLGVNSQS